MGVPPPGMMPATYKSAKTEKTNETVIPRMATYWAFSLSKRPKSASTKKTSAGSTGMAAMISCWPTLCICPLLAPHRGDFVHVHGPARPEHGKDYGEADRDLRGGDSYHEHRVAHPQTPRVRQIIAEGYQGQVDAVDHELHAHEHDDRIAPDQRAPRPDGEQERSDYQVSFEWRRGHEGVQDLLRLRWHYSRTPRSIPSPVLRRLMTMAATIATSNST